MGGIACISGIRGQGLRSAGCSKIHLQNVLPESEGLSIILKTPAGNRLMTWCRCPEVHITGASCERLAPSDRRQSIIWQPQRTCCRSGLRSFLLVNFWHFCMLHGSLTQAQSQE